MKGWWEPGSEAALLWGSLEGGGLAERWWTPLVVQSLPDPAADLRRIRPGVFQPHAFLPTPPAPGCGLVLRLAKLWDLFW